MSAKVSGEMVRESDTVGKPVRKVSAWDKASPDLIPSSAQLSGRG